MKKVYRRSLALAAGALLVVLQGGAWAETKVEGTAEALRVETSESPIQEVLAALRDALKIEYRTSIQLDQPISGTYRGSLQRVLARVLDGYDFILKNSSEKVELVVLGRKGSAAGNTANTDALASAKSANTAEKGQSGAANARTPQTAQQSTVPSMLTTLAEQQLPNAGRSSPRSTPPASGSSNSSNGGGGGTVPSQAEIAALTQQAASKLEALRSSLQRVGR